MAESSLASDLQQGSCHLWFLPSPYPPRSYPFLPSSEVDAARAFLRPKDRLQALVSKALLRWLLSSYLPLPPEAWSFSTSLRGKPHLDPPSPFPLSFNLSHTDAGVACGFFSKPLGIDLEAFHPRRPLDMIAEIALSPLEEKLFLPLSLAQKRSFLLLRWTLKEAYMKALGLGFAIPMHTLSLDDRVSPLRILDEARTTENWSFASLPLSDGLRLSIALPETPHPPVLRLFSLRPLQAEPPFVLSQSFELPSSVFSGDFR